MECLDQQADNFEAVRVRINNAFDQLRREMKEIQRQDIVLFKELMYIRHIILLLSNYPDRRSYSISALDPSATSVSFSPDGATRRRPSLTRVRSAPIERNASEDTIPERDEDDDDEEDGEDDPDRLTQSLNSPNAGLPSATPLERLSPETDFIYALAPLPPVFRRLLESSAEETSGSLESLSRTQHVLSQLSKTYSSATPSSRLDNNNNNTNNKTNNNKTLHDYVTKRRLFQRQRSIDEQDVALTGSVPG